jgi:hypothetical protein
VFPPSPLQFNANVLVLVRGPTVLVPDVFLPPDQAPEAVQVSAFALDQLSVTLSPSSIFVRDAFNETVGASGSVTCTFTLALRVPPGPLQDRVKVLAELRLPVEALPRSVRFPFQAPDAVQLMAPVLDQFSVVADPRRTLEAALLRLTVGAGSGCITLTDSLAVTWPPGPVQLSTKVTLALRGPTL